jgi:hypothetical protein
MNFSIKKPSRRIIFIMSNAYSNTTHKLIVTEKPSQAQNIGSVLNAKKRGDGFLEGNGWLISWCYGHLVELASAEAYGEQYKKWSYDTLPIIPDVWKYTASEGKSKQLAVIRSLMNRADVDSIGIVTMDNVQVDIIHIQTPQAVIYFLHNCFT